MASAQDRRTIPPGERLLFSLARMTRTVSLFHTHNQRLSDIVDAFRGAAEEIRREVGIVVLRLHGGRFYLNRQLVPCSPETLALASKLADYLHARKMQGFRFLDMDRLPDNRIAAFVELLNRAGREKDPLAWFKSRLAGDGHGWVEVLVDQDSLIAGQADGGEPAAASDAKGGSGGKQPRAQILSASAKEAYSRALTIMLSAVGKLPSRKHVSIQQTKRVIQSMIDILMEDESILLGLGTIRDYDDYTFTHSVNVAILSMCLGKRLGLSRALIEQVGLCGLFHDLGKVDVPVKLITKAARLTSEEFEQVKQHPMHSIRQIMRLSADHEMKAKCLLPPFEHHLGVDLSGYPQTGRKEPLSLLGRILSVADHYDALTSNRAYRPRPFSPDMALQLMVQVSGSKLDPIVLKVFIDMIGVFPIGSFLLFDTGEFGLVAEPPEHSAQGRPVVILLERRGEGFVQGERVDLSELDDGGRRFRRNVERSFHPSEYGIQPAMFLV